jgi:hypothetical protein
LDYAVGILLGLGLAASCGFRVFVPLLVSNVASLSGFISFGSGYEWMGSWPAFAVFFSAAVLEVGAYYIPWLDNVLDTIAVPLAAVSGTLLTVSFIADMNPMVQWTLGIIVGGGSAALIKTGASAARLKSSAFTAGFANWIIATIENFTSFVFSVLTILIPIVMGIIACVTIFYFGYRVFNRKKKLKNYIHYQERNNKLEIF